MYGLYVVHEFLVVYVRDVVRCHTVLADFGVVYGFDIVVCLAGVVRCQRNVVVSAPPISRRLRAFLLSKKRKQTS